MNSQSVVNLKIVSIIWFVLSYCCKQYFFQHCKILSSWGMWNVILSVLRVFVYQHRALKNCFTWFAW